MSHAADSVVVVIHVAAPLRVRERLVAAADGPREVVHAGPTAIYVDLDGWCLGLVSAAATRVPCALWSSMADLGSLAGGSVEVHDGELVVAGEQVRVTRLAETRVPPLTLRRAAPAPRSLPVLHGVGDTLLPVDGILTATHVEQLVGRGPGLTPLGDDVLAGWFATRHAAGLRDTNLAAAVRRRLGVTTLLSATLLDCALRGEALPQLTAWLAEPTPSTTEALLTVGASSGTGLLAGAELALTSLTGGVSRPGRAA